jgi:preflagellin peptidase FlaK
VNAPTDLLRLLCLPILGWAAARDIRTRRVPNRTWLPLVALGGALLAWDAWTILPPDERLFAIRVAVSIGIIAPLGYCFWYIGALGGADAKALAALCVLFPTPVSYRLLSTMLPLAESSGVFSLSILTNAALVAGTAPLYLFARNALAGRFSLAGFVARPVRWRSIPDTHGRLLAHTNGLDGGIDLDALRMYLAWRGATLSELRAAPASARNPTSLPAERNTPGDGAIADGGTDDPWGAAAFLDDIDGNAYGTTPARLRRALDALVTNDTLWVTPGIPFLVPLFCGLCITLVYGDLLYAVLGAVGML